MQTSILEARNERNVSIPRGRSVVYMHRRLKKIRNLEYYSIQDFPSARLDKSVRVPAGSNRFLPHWTSRASASHIKEKGHHALIKDYDKAKHVQIQFQRGLPARSMCHLSPPRPLISSSPSSIHFPCLRTVIDTESSKPVHQMKYSGPHERNSSKPMVTTLGRDFGGSGFLLGTPLALAHCTLKMARFPKYSDHWFTKFFVLTASQTHLVDAYTDDGKFVCIKRIRRNVEETRIAQMLSTEELRADPKNHCIPIIEVIDDPDNDSISYMVMPLLRVADSPPFQYVKEIMDFVDQILEVGTLSC